jgi:transposase
MLIIGCDYHPSFQQIAFVDTETGDCGERRLEHMEEADQFYRDLRARGLEVRIGLEASGYSRWFERLMDELGFELWIGDAAAISRKRVRKQKTDKQDAELLLTLLVENRFPRIWVPSREDRDLRQLLWHRHRLVQMQTRLRNQLHAVALNEGVRLKKRMWRPKGRAQLESLPLLPWASRRREDLLRMLDQVDATVAELTSAIEQEAVKRPEVVRLMSHPGVGALTALAFVLIIGKPDRFARSRQVSSYLGLVPTEESSGERRHLGHISKQGNTLLRFLLVAAAQITVRSDPDWRRRYLHLAMRRERAVAKIAMARMLAVRLYWMWRSGWDYAHLPKLGSHAEQPENPLGRSKRPR